MPTMNRISKSPLLIVVCALQVVMMTGCLGQDRVIEERESPDRKHKAELVEGDTGAVGGWVSSVRLSDISPDFMARLFGSNKKTVFGVDVRSTHVTFRWETDGWLAVKCSSCDPSKIEVRESNWKGIEIAYEFE
jgi:hypothetical protein